MATSKNEVRLVVNAEVDGAPDIKSLADELRKVGTAAGASVADAGRLADELDALTAATRANREAEKQARSDSAAAAKARDDARDALARLRAESTSATRATAEYAAAERAARLAIVESNAAAREKKRALAEASAAAAAAATAERNFADAIRRTAAAAQSASRAQAGELTAVGSAVQTLQGQYAALRNVAGLALGGTLAGGLARDLARTADEAANLRARLALVVGDGPALQSAFDGVLDVATRTGTALETTGTLFARVLKSGAEFNLTQRDALALTETINKAVQLSGASAQASDAAITQLIQGLQSGVVRGEEFNSIMEQAPRLAEALARGLNVTTGELRALAAQGALTTDVVLQALQGQADAINSEFSKLPDTVGRAITNLSSAWSVYVAEVDRSTGASSTAAAAINAVARNLDTLGAVLFSVGKAGAALAAINLARSFVETSGAVRAATVATTANTAATVANAAAQRAAAAAGAESAASAGRLASILGTLKLLSFVGVVTNLREIGTAIGEGIAKLAGYGKASKELEAQEKADAEAARASAAAFAALAQEAQRTADAKLGLTKEARALVAEFDQLTQKGTSAAEALDKVTKSLDLGDVKGIQNASAALDALALRGSLTGDQIREALAAALRGEDLAIFEAQARAAFDGSEQGARRLAAAIDAIGAAALERAGTSAQELGTGFSAAANSAINDVDALAATLQRLGARGDDADRALSAALDKATQAANTERAARAVLERVEALGEAGQLAGLQLEAALDKARAKLDEVQPGVSSLGEALRTLGVQSRVELQRTAETLGAAYRRIADSGEVSLAQQIAAYARWREAALAASGGVESAQLRLEAVILENRAAVAGLGETIEQAMGRATSATDKATTAQQRYLAALTEDPARLVGGSGGVGITSSGLTGVRDPGSSAGPGAIGAGSAGFSAGYDVPVPEGYRYTLDPYAPGAIRAGTAPNGFAYPGYFAPILGGPAAPASTPAPAPESTSSSSRRGRSVTLMLNVGGRSFPVASDESTADALLAQIERERLASGG